MKLNRSALLAVAVLAALSTGCGKKKLDTGKLDGDAANGASTKDDMDRVDPNEDKSEPLGGDDIPGTSGPLRDVYFEFDRYDIPPDQRPTLEANADWLRRNTGRNVMVEGHCDERGTEEYNLALGDRRAHAAKAYLQTLGVPSGRMQTISYGKLYPVDPRHSEDAWAKNRRAHFTLLDPKVGDARAPR